MAWRSDYRPRKGSHVWMPAERQTQGIPWVILCSKGSTVRVSSFWNPVCGQKLVNYFPLHIRSQSRKNVPAPSPALPKHSTPNNMPYSTTQCFFATLRPHRYLHLKQLPKQQTLQHLHQHPNCAHPSTKPSISQITSPLY